MFMQKKKKKIIPILEEDRKEYFFYRRSTIYSTRKIGRFFDVTYIGMDEVDACRRKNLAIRTTFSIGKNGSSEERFVFIEQHNIGKVNIFHRRRMIFSTGKIRHFLDDNYIGMDELDTYRRKNLASRTTFSIGKKGSL